MWDLIVSVPDHCLSFYFALDWAILGRSFTNNKKSRIPRIEPWGTPLVTSVHSDAPLLRVTRWRLLRRMSTKNVYVLQYRNNPV